jgi:hypothetical protein
MKYIGMALLLLAMGCANFKAATVATASASANAADKALQAAHWYMCRGASVGAVERRFGKTPGPYKAICAGSKMGVIGK